MPMETAYFAGGCFWCITPIFKETDGVFNVISGYSGGDERDPVYADVKNQRTGHRETIRIDFDPEKVSFAQLVEIFLNSVDPFDGAGQFIDRGHSYTLAVYYMSETQKSCACEAVQQLEKEAGRPVYVCVEPFKTFFSAEEEHQDYYLKHPEEFERELIESGRKHKNIMQALQNAKNLLLMETYTCVLCNGDHCFTTQQRGVKPLVQWLEQGNVPVGFAAADKVVGKATAFLYCLLGAKAVYANVMSRSAMKILEANDVYVQYAELTDYIENRTKDGICPFEMAVMEISDPKQALEVIYRKMNEMGIF